MTEKERIEEVRVFFKITKKEFSDVLGYSSSQSYTNYLNGSNSLSMKMVRALKKYDSRINLNWLLEGEGNMLLLENSTPVKNDDLKRLKEIIKSLEESAAESRESRKTMSKYVAILELRMKELEEKLAAN